MSKITITKLAKELNLSASTISRALQDSQQIGAETKQRVLELAKELNYMPNFYASGLRRKVSKTIAVVIPEVADSFFAQAINGIESVAQALGYHVLIYLTHESFTKEQAILNEFQNGRVDGVLLSVTAETTQSQHLQELQNKGVPVVLFDRVFDEISTAKITTNDFESSYNATRHLIQNNCKRIAILSISTSLGISKKRLEGYKQALTDHGIWVQEEDIVFCADEEEQTYQQIREMLARADRPDGVISTVEKLASCIYQACRELSLRIPDDIKVLSFSNLQTASYLNPPLTTVTQPAYDMGKVAATCLFKALIKKNISLTAESQVIDSTLFIRSSTMN